MQIQRDVYVLRDAVKNPIEYVQGSDAVPIIFTVRDFDIPAKSTARIYVEKPSTRAIYNDVPGAISGNKITIDVDKQMMAEAGFGAMQVEIRMGEDTLATFEWPLHIKRSLPPIDSTNGSNFLDEYIESLKDLGGSTEEATEEAKEAAQKANEAASKANAAAGKANEAAGNASVATKAANDAAASATDAASEASAAAGAVNEAVDRADKVAQDIQDKADRGDFTATIEVRDTITGEPGTEASVRNVGTEKNAILDFFIPQGLTGRVENIDTVTVEFQQAATRENIESNETFKGMFGKIKRWFADLGTAAFCAAVNNLTTTTAGRVLDARQGKILSDQIAQINRIPTLFEASNGLQDGDTFTLSAPCWEFKFLVFKLLNSSIFLAASMPYSSSSPGNIYGTVNASGDLSIGVFSIFVYGGADGKAMEIRNIRRALVRESGITMSAAGDYKLHRVYGIK